MFKNFLILLVALGVCWFFLQKGQMSSEVKPKSLNRLPSSVMDKKDCRGPCLSLSMQPSDQTIVIDAEDDAVNVSLMKGDELKIKLLNSKAYDVVQTFGSNEADFANQTLIVNWTLSDISEYTITEKKNRFRFYRTQWRAVGEPKFKTAVFVVDSYDVKSPEFVLHHQPMNAGIQQLTILGSGSKHAPLVLARNSLLGYELRDPSKIITGCRYLAPNGSEEDCSAWSKNQMIRSISEQDVGIHKIKVFTQSEDFNYEFRVLGIQ